jgi:hypothetical protein
MSVRPFHCADLDPALEFKEQRIELMLKWSLLFCHQLVFSETQLLHTPYVRGSCRTLSLDSFSSLGITRMNHKKPGA